MHFSKVRSLTLDTWEPELLKVSEENLMYINKRSSDLISFCCTHIYFLLVCFLMCMKITVDGVAIVELYIPLAG